LLPIDRHLTELALDSLGRRRLEICSANHRKAKRPFQRVDIPQGVAVGSAGGAGETIHLGLGPGRSNRDSIIWVSSLQGAQARKKNPKADVEADDVSGPGPTPSICRQQKNSFKTAHLGISDGPGGGREKRPPFGMIKEKQPYQMRSEAVLSAYKRQRRRESKALLPGASSRLPGNFAGNNRTHEEARLHILD